MCVCVCVHVRACVCVEMEGNSLGYCVAQASQGGEDVLAGFEGVRLPNMEISVSPPSSSFVVSLPYGTLGVATHTHTYRCSRLSF